MLDDGFSRLWELEIAFLVVNARTGQAISAIRYSRLRGCEAARLGRDVGISGSRLDGAVTSSSIQVALGYCVMSDERWVTTDESGTHLHSTGAVGRGV